MPTKILLTSFTTWLPHQKSNSSDDLLQAISVVSTSLSLTFLRQLPVDTQLASCCVINKITQIQPDIVICCGMAECRTKLTIESNAACKDVVFKTSVHLEDLVTSENVEISHDAGKYVCEGLYFSVLKHLCDRQLNTRCIFVHVPVLNWANLPEIVADFQEIIKRLVGLTHEVSKT